VGGDDLDRQQDWLHGRDLRRWCREEASRRTAPAALAADDQARLKLLEREVRELRRANEILRKASAYFAMAELDRREK
jgi:transposase-like protein